MINVAVLQGNLTRDAETRTTTTGKTVTTFTLAVNRFKDGVDFINCVAWESIGETIARNTSKGTQITVAGRVQSRSFEDKAGQKRTVHEIIVTDFSFCGKREKQDVAEQDFEEVGIEDGVPF